MRTEGRYSQVGGWYVWVQYWVGFEVIKHESVVNVWLSNLQRAGGRGNVWQRMVVPCSPRLHLIAYMDDYTDSLELDPAVAG